MKLDSALIEALILSRRGGEDCDWINDAAVLAIMNPAPGDTDFKPCFFAVLMDISPHGEIRKFQAFLLNDDRRCVRELSPEEPLSHRVRVNIQRISECTRNETRKRRISEFAQAMKEKP